MTDLELFAQQTILQGGIWYELEPGLYKSQSWHEVRNNCVGDTPVYQVFDRSGKRLFASTNYISAFKFWMKIYTKLILR